MDHTARLITVIQYSVVALLGGCVYWLASIRTTAHKRLPFPGLAFNLNDFALQLVLEVKQLPEATAVDALIRSGDLDRIGSSVEWHVQRLGIDRERERGSLFEHSTSVPLPVFDPELIGLRLPAPSSHHAYIRDGHRYSATVYDLDEKSGHFVTAWMQLYTDTDVASAANVVDDQVDDCDQAADDGAGERNPLSPDGHS
ncbi:TPA: hypothetical protein ACG5JQ_000357 [Stenotrophomonas maltophilia]|uniref:hypothetical protein n=1 Tax=Stenotrophomonas maltophilia TaxID=40324 RepID=UPI0013DA437C|nr:hypothetical protein [Stenotrophomonas maltophilia]HDX0925497.1 hypothetical protein [Stenotrophomonas maltophilia]